MPATVIASCSGALPPYTQFAKVPCYSPEPARDELILEQTPRSRARAPTGNYLKKSGRDTVILTEQDENAEYPTYGRQGTISGLISVESRESVSEVVLKVRGKLEVILPEGGSATTTLVDDRYTLWSSADSHTSTCPSSVPFAAVLPAKFQDEAKTYPLPPSYEIAQTVILVKISYTISLVVTRVRSRKLHFLSTSNTISIRFNYSPRTRPYRPIQPSVSGFLTDVKTMPEEWRQVVAQRKARPTSAMQPIDIHLLIPAAEIYGLEDTIPFHVQLAGPVASLREFLPDPATTTSILGTLVRQIIIDVNGLSTACNVVIGYAKLFSCPPSASAPDSEASLDWEGEVRCKVDVAVGAFDAGVVRVQDFIVIDIRPPVGPASQFPALRHSHPIKFVTDSWLDSNPSRGEETR
ncbi:hypothetical protein B0H10DRAFT_2215513 [Mycena sp. CBHHK59/15]|nr:hypothetical protein B0H10DRAFT_2215513 [Mycena sp. CBHHK59/15]